MLSVVVKVAHMCGQLSSWLPRRNTTKRSLLMVASVGSVFVLFVTAIYMRRRRKTRPPKDVANGALEDSNHSKRKRRPKRNRLDLPVGSSGTHDERRLVSRHKRDHSIMSETSTLSSVKSFTSRQSGKNGIISPGTKQYFEAEKLYQKGVNAIETALEQWEKASIVLESSDMSSDHSEMLSPRKSNHSESASSHQTPMSKIQYQRYRSESEGSPANRNPLSGAGDHDNALASLGQTRSFSVHEIEDKLQLFMRKAERLQEKFEGVLYSSGSEEGSDTDVTVTGFDADSDTASFVSAQDMWETLTADDVPREGMKLYEEALLAVESGKVRCRKLRTDMLECFSDQEFLAKLHCVRQAVDVMLQDAAVRQWLIENGRSMMESLLRSTNRSTSHFNHSFNTLVNYASDPANLDAIEDELKYRKVVSMTFYDVVLDFIIMDSFDDLENPPRQLVAVLGNRWLTSSIKETALNTAVWSLLKAKCRMLRCQDGFIAKFYAISETISPVLAWGFLGTDEKLKYDCEKFKFEVLSFLRGLFSFERIRYSTVEQMSVDISSLMKEKVQRVLDHFEMSCS